MSCIKSARAVAGLGHRAPHQRFWGGESVARLFQAKQLLDPGQIGALDDRAADDGPRHARVAEAEQHDLLPLLPRYFDQAIADMIAGKHLADLPAIRAPIGAIERDLLGADRMCRFDWKVNKGDCERGCKE